MPLNRPYPAYMYDAPPGWSDLVAELESQLERIAPDTEVIQIKEKFGGLRYYATGASTEGQALIAQYEERSFRVCQVCGTEGRLRSDRGWWTTLCDACAEEGTDGAPDPGTDG